MTIRRLQAMLPLASLGLFIWLCCEAPKAGAGEGKNGSPASKAGTTSTASSPFVVKELPKGVLDLGNDIMVRLVHIPAGKYLQYQELVFKGTPGRGVEANDGVYREITITKPFYIGVFLITHEQYEQLMGRAPPLPKGIDPVAKAANGPKSPRTTNWYDAVEFCKRASKASGCKVRLPTLAEWEYACKAGTKTWYFFGDDRKLLGEYAWYVGNNNSAVGIHFLEVGLKKPNPWGLYDMYCPNGQWCSDWAWGVRRWSDPTVDPKGPDNPPTPLYSRNDPLYHKNNDCRAAPGWSDSLSGSRDVRSIGVCRPDTLFPCFRIVVEGELKPIAKKVQPTTYPAGPNPGSQHPLAATTQPAGTALPGPALPAGLPASALPAAALGTPVLAVTTQPAVSPAIDPSKGFEQFIKDQPPGKP